MITFAAKPNSLMKKYLTFIILIFVLSACRLNSSIMLKTKRDYAFAKLDSVQDIAYKISENDKLSFQLLTNKGFKLIERGSLNASGGAGSAEILSVIEIQVEFDGFAKLPSLGKVKLSGMTLREAEKYLEELYTEYYVDPFVILKVTNRRVVVFPGAGGEARVVTLINDNVNVLEALASAGGIANDGIAQKVKLIRGEGENAKVYQFDLSTIEGYKSAHIILQANDVIYVEPRLKIAQNVLGEIAPIVSILTSILLIITITRTL